MDRFKLDKLVLNLDLVSNHCSTNQSEGNGKLIEYCERLIKSARFVDQIAYDDDFMFEGMPENGFVLYLRVITSYTDQIVNQIKTKNKIDFDFIKLFTLVFLYEKWLIETYNVLKMEAKDELNGSLNEKTNKSLMLKGDYLHSLFFYEIVK